MKRLAIITALAASIAAPALAQTASGPVYDVTFSDRSVPAHAEALARFAADADSVLDRHANLTLISGAPAVGADIFARILAESD